MNYLFRLVMLDTLVIATVHGLDSATKKWKHVHPVIMVILQEESHVKFVPAH